MRYTLFKCLLATLVCHSIASTIPLTGTTRLSKRQAGTANAPDTINTDLFPTSTLNATAWALIVSLNTLSSRSS
jgi:hypothetical protein